MSEQEQEPKNKYGVPYHDYALSFAGGGFQVVNVGDEDDWGNIQACTPEDCEDWLSAIGFGNDCDGHKKIARVIDLEDGSTWTGNLAIHSWYSECVGIYADNYSSKGHNMKKTKNNQKKVSEIVADIHENLKEANSLFLQALQGVKELTDIVATKAMTVKEKEAPVKEKGTPVKEKKTRVKKDDTVQKQQEEQSPRVHRRTPASVRLTPHEITLNFGGQPVRELAENDAKDFLNNPKIFWYRNTQFPDPKRYGVQPRVEQARVVKRTAPQFTRSPWTVSVTIHVDGDDKRAESWGVGVYNKNRSDQE